MSYYYLHRERNEENATATAPEEIDPLTIPDATPVRGWQPFTLSLSSGRVVDFLTTDILVLYSNKLKGVVEQYQRPIDPIQWLPALVAHPDGRVLKYWFLHFNSCIDTLDWEQTQVINRQEQIIGRAILDLQKAEGRHIFGLLGRDVRVVVSEALKTAIEGAACTGIVFGRVPDNGTPNG